MNENIAGFEFHYLNNNITIKKENGSTFQLNVTDSDRIFDLKRRIEDITSILSSEMTLEFEGAILLNDEKSIKDYKIISGSTIIVKSNLEFTIAPHNLETFFVAKPKNQNISDVKNEIFLKTGLKPREQILTYEKVFDMQDDKSLGDLYKWYKDPQTLTLKSINDGGRGICLIINNENYSYEEMRRTGSNIDEQNIRATFERFGFEILLRSNVAGQDMVQVFNEAKDKVEESDKMLIVFILSHGNEQGIITVDNEVFSFKDIWKPFSKKQFTKYKDKPKLFFFSCPKASIDTEDVECDKSGMFFGYAACSQFACYRSIHHGTFYIKYLCNVVIDHPSWDISDIHQEIQSRLSRMHLNTVLKPQLPFYENILKDKVYFVKK